MLIYFELVHSCVSIGLRVDFGPGIKDRGKKKIRAEGDERDGVEKRVGVSTVSLLPRSKTFFLMSCLGEKRGVPFHAEQGVVQEGPIQESLAPVIPTSFFLFSPLSYFSLSL